MYSATNAPALLRVAIDGPVAAGKGSVARKVASRLNLVYIDTGAMYRTAALLAQRAGVSPDAESEIVALLKKVTLDQRTPNDQEQDGRLTTVLLDDEDISWKIRTKEVSALTAKVAALAEVRKVLVQKQQEIAANRSVVMEGRDITYKVLPNAELKIYLTASEEVRARRRHEQLLTTGEDSTLEQALKELRERDKLDMQRETDPLKIVDDAWVLDTSKLTIDQVVDDIVGRIMELPVQSSR